MLKYYLRCGGDLPFSKEFGVGETSRQTGTSYFGQIKRFLRDLYIDERGSVTTEYVIVTGLLAIALIGAAGALADAARLWFWRKALIIALP